MESRGTLRALAALAVGVVAGGVAVVSLFQLVDHYQSRIADARQPEDTVMVMVAARDLYPGVAIEEADLVAVEMPPRFVPGGAFLTPEHVIGQRPRERVLANELVRADRLSTPELGLGLNAIVPRQQRAISVEIGNGEAVAGFLEPGDMVDMLVTLEDVSQDALGGTTVTETLLQEVFVLAVNDRASKGTADDASKRDTVTFLVAPQDAEKVAHAERIGELRLSLRPRMDHSLLVREPIVREVIPRPVVRRTRAPEAPPNCTEVLIIAGHERRVETVDSPDPRCKR